MPVRHEPGSSPLQTMESDCQIVTVFVVKRQGLLEHHLYFCSIKIRLLPAVSQKEEERRKGRRKERERGEEEREGERQ